MTLTKQQAIENHRKMWNWIADETLRQKRRMKKREYFEAMGIPVDERPIYNCYCCGYACNNCDICPVKWPDDTLYSIIEKTCTKTLSLYKLWYDALDYKEATKYARKIAELPERK